MKVSSRHEAYITLQKDSRQKYVHQICSRHSSYSVCCPCDDSCDRKEMEAQSVVCVCKEEGVQQVKD